MDGSYNGCNNTITMATTLKLIQVGNSVGVILPKELLEKLRADKGDLLHVTETPDGLKLSSLDEDFAARMDVAERIMREDRNILRKLAE